MEQVMALGSIMDANKEMSTASKPNEENSKNKRICFVCRRIVWIGGKDSAPRVVGPCQAYPLDTDWELEENAHGGHGSIMWYQNRVYSEYPRFFRFSIWRSPGAVGTGKKAPR